MTMFNAPLYGSYRTRTFIEIFPDEATFTREYNTNGVGQPLDADHIKTLYYLLYGRYGNSHIASSDENTFKYRIWSNIFMYGPAWQKRLEIQADIMAKDIAELSAGDFAIHNHSYNPGTTPSTTDTEELPTINEQNTTRYKKGLMSTYTQLWELISTDVTKYFLDTFKKLFLQIVNPELPLWYVTQLNDQGDEDND